MTSPLPFPPGHPGEAREEISGVGAAGGGAAGSQGGEEEGQNQEEAADLGQFSRGERKEEIKVSPIPAPAPWGYNILFLFYQEKEERGSSEGGAVNR